MKIKPWEKLRAPADEDDFFGTGDDLFGSDDDQPTNVDDDDPPLNVDDDPPPPDGVTNTPTQGGNPFDPGEISRAIAEGFKIAGQQQQQQPKQLTPEELAKRMNVWDPSDDEASGIAAALSDPDLTPAERKAALKRIAAGIRDEVLTAAGFRMEEELGKIRSTVNQVIPLVTMQMKREKEKEFYGEYPKLKQFGQVVEIAAQQLGVEFERGQVDPKADPKQLLAERTLKIIRGIHKNAPDDLIKKQPKGSAPSPAATTTAGNRGSTNSPRGGKGRASDIWD